MTQQWQRGRKRNPQRAPVTEWRRAPSFPYHPVATNHRAHFSTVYFLCLEYPSAIKQALATVSYYVRHKSIKTRTSLCCRYYEMCCFSQIWVFFFFKTITRIAVLYFHRSEYRNFVDHRPVLVKLVTCVAKTQSTIPQNYPENCLTCQLITAFF